MKRFISLTLIILFIINMILPVCAAQTSYTPFADTVKGSWYNKAVTYCYRHGYMKGTSHGFFSPGETLTRAMTVQIIYSINNFKVSANQKTFTDVPKGRWYHNAIEWAYAEKIVSGTGNGQFSPDNDVTRQDFYAILYKYSQAFSHYDTDEICDNYLYFTDVDDIAGYAIDAMNWAAYHGFLSGYEDGTLRPLTTMTRAEVASVMKRFDSTLGHKWVQNGETVMPTCNSEGHISYTCKGCDITKDVALESGHIYTAVTVTPATCTDEGYAEYKCSNCNAISSSVIPAKGHSFVLTSTAEPTPMQSGYSIYTCEYCSSSYRTADGKEPLGRTEGWDSNYDGKLTIDEYFGAYDIVGFLTEHMDDYVGTPYVSLSKYLHHPYMLIHDKGSYPDSPGMNCTGFVASVLWRCGGNPERMNNVSSGSYGNAYNWQVTLNRNDIFHYTFYSISAALNSGLLKKGDIFLFLPEAVDSNPGDGLDPDYHFGIFWGDTPYHNLFWHSTGATRYNWSCGVRGLKNQITAIGSGTPYSCIYVYPLQRG